MSGLLAQGHSICIQEVLGLNPTSSAVVSPEQRGMLKEGLFEMWAPYIWYLAFKISKYLVQTHFSAKILQTLFK